MSAGLLHLEEQVKELTQDLLTISRTTAYFKPELQNDLHSQINQYIQHLMQINPASYKTHQLPSVLVDYVHQEKHPNEYSQKVIESTIAKNQKWMGRQSMMQTLASTLSETVEAELGLSLEKSVDVNTARNLNKKE